MKNWLSALLQTRRRRQRAPALGPPVPPGFDFDAFARDMAAGLSRREAIRRLSLGLGGALLATIGLGAGPTLAAGNSDCAQFCHDVFSSSDAGNCTSDAARGTGLCYQCGPAAPAGHPDFCNISGVGPTCCPATAPYCCGGSCVNLASDGSNCGQCGLVCPAGQGCCGGACTPLNTPQHCGACGTVCAAGQGCCPGTAGALVCTDLTTLQNCGGCGNICPQADHATPVCSQGTCGYACSDGFGDCNASAVDGCETDLLSDPSHCGACNHACPPGESCVNGKCTCGNLGSDCPGGKTCCSGMCEDLSSDPSHCGACGRACGAGETCSGGACHCGDGPVCGDGLVCAGGGCCPSGQTNCSGTCADLSGDPTNCGRCGNICDPVIETIPCTAADLLANPNCQSLITTAAQYCSQGICCPTDETNCGGTCVRLQTNPAHCGSCDNVCATGESCMGGICCSAGQTNCGGRCVMLSSDPRNCGACGNACTPGNICCFGTCVDLQTSSAHCGSCGNTCNPGETCSFGQCFCGNSPACQRGLVCANGLCCPTGQPTNCSGVCTDLSSDSANCGACGKVCDGDCSLGICCPGGQVNCGGTCADLQTSSTHCGSCTHVCAVLDHCSHGVCCPGGQSYCSGSCIDTSADVNNCGDCLNQCQDGEYCNLGKCSPCPTGQTLCPDSGLGGHGTICVDLQTNQAFCGSCDIECRTGPFGNPGCCHGTCVDLNFDDNNCNACDNVCGNGTACRFGFCV